MPLQRRKKKKKAPPKKTSGMSQVQNVKVVVNAATAPRRRRARAKKAGAPVSFGGGGGGGLAQVVTGPSVSQDVLQQSQELRQTVAMLQAGPLRNNAVLGEIGQIEKPLLADDQPVTRAQLKYIMGSVIEQQTLQNEARPQGFEQYRALAGQQLNILDRSIHSLSTNKPEPEAVDRSESPEPLLTPTSPRGRSPTVREASTSAAAGSPPATPSPKPAKKSRATYPQAVKDRVFAAWSENKQKPKGSQESLESLARSEGLTLNAFNNIRQSESRKRA